MPGNDETYKERDEENYSLPVSRGSRSQSSKRQNGSDLWAAWNPFPEFDNFYSGIMRLLDRFTSNFSSIAAFPETDIRRADGNIIIKIEVPGLNKNNLNAEVFEDYIRLAGKQHKRDEYNDSARNAYGMRGCSSAFFRVLPLPARVRSDEARIDYSGETVIITVPEA